MTHWGIEQLDLDAYLKRIGVEEPTLHTMHTAHLTSIPFDNITVLLARFSGGDLAEAQNDRVTVELPPLDEDSTLSDNVDKTLPAG